jgi:hypothetical protein
MRALVFALMLLCAIPARAGAELESPSRPPQPRSNGRAATIAGAVLCSIGGTLLVGSSILWALGGKNDPIGSAMSLTGAGFGGAVLLPGVIFFSLGVRDAHRYGRWQRTTALSFAPVVAASTTSAAGGVSIRF